MCRGSLIRFTCAQRATLKFSGHVNAIHTHTPIGLGRSKIFSAGSLTLGPSPPTLPTQPTAMQKYLGGLFLTFRMREVRARKGRRKSGGVGAISLNKQNNKNAKQLSAEVSPKQIKEIHAESWNYGANYLSPPLQPSWEELSKHVFRDWQVLKGRENGSL